MKNFTLSTACAVLAATILAGCAAYSAAPAQSVALLEPLDGAVVTSPLKVRFGVTGMKVEPAGDSVANSGHHHLLINLDSIKAGEAIPFTPKHMHFGKGQTEAEIKLEPGNYRITAQFANGEHQSYGAAMSQTVKITVK